MNSQIKSKKKKKKLCEEYMHDGQQECLEY